VIPKRVSVQHSKKNPGCKKKGERGSGNKLLFRGEFTEGDGGAGTEKGIRRKTDAMKNSLKNVLPRTPMGRKVEKSGGEVKGNNWGG